MLCFHMYKPRTNSEYASNQPVYNGRNTSSGKALACWFFTCTHLKQTLFKPQIYGTGPCQQARECLKKSSINFFFARGNCRFPPLPRIEVWLGFVHMKTQQIEVWSCIAFSNRMRSTEMFSKYAWSLYIWKHSTSKVSPKSAHSSVKWAARRH